MTAPVGTWLFPMGLVVMLLLDRLAGETALLLALAAGVAVLGLPHGALDPEVARQRLGVRGFARSAIFLLGYLALGLAALLPWWHWPTLALSVFLLYSAWHFGEDTGERLGVAGALGYGLLVVFLPLALQPAASAAVLAYLAPGGPGPLFHGAGWLCAAGAALLVLGLCRADRPQPSDWRDPLLLLLGAWLLAPLAYFVAYFCFLHSPRHLLETARALGLHDWPSRLRATAPATLATWALAGLALPWLLQQSAESAVLQMVFIGLAALTVPHMVLESLAAPRRGSSPEGQSGC
ncbi:Brp/Blh family beta-carotene 15,15'-dioxygenase [Sediminicurvatus halobius]|nr:Brp/Blh family beta-carotene 15,15'-dioxygenase [Spiribacter halobius]UEX76500.1 Brp/Blh family beta-carotene 15,15'-dioxygenase [Spiribacter halobius]